MKSARFAGAAALLLGALPGCNSTPQAVGNVSSIIVITTDSLWTAIGDSLQRALEPPIFTVRDERTFELTHVSPRDPKWTDLRTFRQVLVIGTAADGWVAPVLRAAGVSDSRPLLQTRDVWARNQLASAIVVSAERSAQAALGQVPRLAALTDSVFRAYARERMYTSRPDTRLRDSLRAQAGYAILLPNVYHRVRRGADVQLFQNSTQIGGDLVRSVLIAARPGTVEPTGQSALAWRDSVARTEYRPAQTTQRAQLRAQPLQVRGHVGVEIQGIWEGNDPTWPMGGPFIARIIPCPSQNRTYLVDAWLYAPGPQRGSRYEYMIQLQTIMDSFECAAPHATHATANVR
jgi:Domain of unknown function (DUF4837)